MTFSVFFFFFLYLGLPIINLDLNPRSRGCIWRFHVAALGGFRWLKFQLDSGELGSCIWRFHVATLGGFRWLIFSRIYRL